MNSSFHMTSITVLITILVLCIWQFSSNLLYNQALRSVREGDRLDAAEVYNRVNRIYPINSMSYYFASRNNLMIYRETGDPQFFEQSVALAQESIRFSPFDSVLHNFVWQLYFEIGDFELAGKHLSLAVDYACYRIGMYLDLGQLFVYQERYVEAKEIFLKGHELEDVVLQRSGREYYLREQLQMIYYYLDLIS